MKLSLTNKLSTITTYRKHFSRKAVSLYSHLNELWAILIIEELVRQQVTHFFIAPGSRSTPLTLAAINNAEAKVHTHFDERGLAFMALGFSKASAQGAAIITTSGTAVANLLPAVVEASLTHQKLILLTADRPDELIGTGANQSIHQPGIFGQYVCHALNLPAPTEEYPAPTLLMSIDETVDALNNGPVHINVPFREPLYPDCPKEDFEDWLTPVQSWQQDHHPYCLNSVQYSHAGQQEEGLELVQRVATSFYGKRTLVIVGSQPASVMAQSMHSALHRLSGCSYAPVMVDVCSQLRGWPDMISFYDGLLVNADFHYLISTVEAVIFFGERLVSKRLVQTLLPSGVPVCHVTQTGSRDDTLGAVHWRVKCAATIFVDKFIVATDALKQSKNLDASSISTADLSPDCFLNEMHLWNELAKKQLNAHWPVLGENVSQKTREEVLREWSSVSDFLHSLPENTSLFLGNSLPIRMADMLLDHHRSKIVSNRGASGIDGLLATATGVALASDKPTGLIIGDMSLLHDLNSLAMLGAVDHPMIILLLNNNGGNIFELLPLPGSASVREQYYQMPHQLQFRSLVEGFGLKYQQPITRESLKQVLNNAWSEFHPTVIEIVAEPGESVAELKAYLNDARHWQLTK